MIATLKVFNNKEGKLNFTNSQDIQLVNFTEQSNLSNLDISASPKRNLGISASPEKSITYKKPSLSNFEIHNNNSLCVNNEFQEIIEFRQRKRKLIVIKKKEKCYFNC